MMGRSREQVPERARDYNLAQASVQTIEDRYWSLDK
jgi:hypothetical protein